MRQNFMLVLQVNGKARELPPGSNVENLIASMQLNGKRYAIELNGEIVPKSAHAATPLNHGDKLEVVIAVGGG
jgi:thiamine biosynthesis protein ThiS